MVNGEQWRKAMKAIVLISALAMVSSAGAQNVTNLDQQLAANQERMQARMQAEELRMTAEQVRILARLEPAELKLATEQNVLMARMEPLALPQMGMQMQVGGNVVRVGQVKDDLFAGTEKFAKGASDVTEVNLDPSMLGMIPAGSGASGLAKKMKFMVIHTYEYPKEGMYNPEDVEVYRKKLEDGTWNCGIHVKDKSGTTDICTRTAPDHESSEMVILTAEPKELTFIHMSGNMSLSDLQKMGGGAAGRRVLPVPPAPPEPPATPSTH